LIHLSAGGLLMPLDRVVVSSEEIEQIKPAPDAPPSSFHRLPSPVPWWARASLSPLVLVLPVLCVVAVILRVAFRSQPPRVKYAWVSFLSTLLVVSGILTTVGAVLLVSFAPIPALVNTGLPELDERSQFPTLPSPTELSSADVSAQLKPLVIVVSPAVRLWNRQEVASNGFGAGVLLRADKDGYLFATANHVVHDSGHGSTDATEHVLVATESGIWAKADVVGQSPQLDLALLWMGRHSGSADFVQPLSAGRDGAEIFVIGHPEGLRYTLSTGIISGLRDDEVQISAVVSPGNSGGPVYDHRGNLIGIVSSKFDHNRDANAENLSFAAKADGFQRISDWTFRGGGQQQLEKYLEAIKKNRDAASDRKN
jgi:S1-C subfamily serine protease